MAVADLTKARSVMRLRRTGRATVEFIQDVDDGERPRFELTMFRSLHDEMGAPDTITLAVEPGDQLNDA